MTSKSLQTMDELCGVLKALGKKNRLNIAVHLLKGERSVSEIEVELNIKQPNLSHELKVLRNIGLVSTRRESKVIHYSLANPVISTFVRGLIHLTQLTSEDDEIDIQLKSVLNLAPKAQQNMEAIEDCECGNFPRIAYVA